MSSLQQFIRATDALIQFDAELDDANLSGYSVHSLEVHREEMKSIWAGIKVVYEKCMEMLSQKDGSKEDLSNTFADQETFSSRYQSAYSTYVSSMARLSARIQELSIPKRDILPQSNLKTIPRPYSIQLPPCDIAVFKGDYHSWPTFRDHFIALYINNPEFNNIAKYFHLNRVTTGEAKDIVERYPPTERGFEEAWEGLKKRFENKRSLIFSQYRILFNLPYISYESCEEIKKLQRQINSCVSAFELYNVKLETFDSTLVYICYTRLPATTLAIWEQSLTNKMEMPKWSQLNDFLTNRFQTLETVSDVKRIPDVSITDNSRPRTQPRRVNSNHANITMHSPTPCRLCPSSEHPIRQCPKFLQMNIKERTLNIRELGLCFNCFAKQHVVKNCTSLFNCRTCHKRHNTLLHNESDHTIPSTQVNPAERVSESPSLQNIQNCFSSNSKSIILGTAIVQVHHRGIEFPARAFIDTGSEGSFISERLFRRISPSYRNINTPIGGLNCTVSGQAQKVCAITIGSNGYSDKKIEVCAYVLPELSGNLPSCFVDPGITSKLPSFTLADPHFYKTSAIDILIGEDILDQFELDGFRRNVYGRLRAKETIFGWVISGNLEKYSSVPTQVLTCVSKVSLEKQITRFWEVEDVPQKPIISQSDRFCEDLYARTTQRREDGRYIVSLPFKKTFTDGLERLGNSRGTALAQFARNELRLSKNVEQKAVYDSVVQEYLEFDHMKKVSPPIPSQRIENYYLPHHAVIKPESSTTKVRVVFNASCKTSSGLSLNDILHTGPILQSDLILLLLKWRVHRYVFNSDIEKMYRQILVNPDDTPFQRILFRNSFNEEIQDYELKTVTFGVNCAPYLAIRTLIQLASDVEKTYPLASDILKKSMYVDDTLYGAPDIPTAIQARNQLIEALRLAGFHLHKWTSNSSEILEGIPKSDLLQEEFCEFEDTSNAKTLGIRWNAKNDIFYFSARPLSTRKNITKRELLSEISKLFDPAGWLSPFIILSKILMRNVWESKSDWDQCLSDSCLRDWNLFIQHYPDIDKIKIPRWISFTPKCSVEIHGFCDASERAYAATIYVKTIYNGSATIVLLAAKSKVAPVKCISLPRLELCGAVLLSKMLDSIVHRTKYVTK